MVLNNLQRLICHKTQIANQPIIQFVDGTLTSIVTPGQSGSGRNSNEWVLCSLQMSRTGASSSYFVSLQLRIPFLVGQSAYYNSCRLSGSTDRKKKRENFKFLTKELSFMVFRLIGIAFFFLEVPLGKWLSSQELDTATRVQILDEADCISHSTNTLGKGMNPIILPPAMGK